MNLIFWAAFLKDDQKLEIYLSLEGDTNFGVWEIDLLVFPNLELKVSF